MVIKIDSLLEGARKARGVVVIVDVFRAFTTAAVVLSQGAVQIIMVAEPEEALQLRSRGIGDICMGEVNGKRPDGFDLGNSPYEIMQASLQDKVVIQSTRAGTMGVTSATLADVMYAGSFVVAEATAKVILKDNPPYVTIVAMGRNAQVRTDEDELCALYLRNLIQGRRPDPDAIYKLVLESGEIAKFRDPNESYFHPQDCDIALEMNKYDFAIRITRQDNLLVASRQR
jgi:2-phosphosulfolactate phosphatase